MNRSHFGMFRFLRRSRRRSSNMAPRANIYGFPHKGLRNGLGQLLFKAGNVNVNDADSVKDLQDLSNTIVTLLHLHQSSEDEVLLPDVEAKAPGSTKENAEEHEKLEKMVEAFEKAVGKVMVNCDADVANEAYTKISAFFSAYLTHMAAEESEMNKVIWANFDDGEIMAWHGRIMEKLSPEQKMMWIRFIVPALNEGERHAMLGQLKANAPIEAYNATIDMLGNYMSAKDLKPFQA
eukprot:TRINITY_DN11071_c0_g1_i1.p2 TRINITY_DN11071_c0_g1~~TRINITY_DN11071_c0_g1_i1.p2  ORF type:complete len:236 (+),score=66.39 TRINITY_DN11071_c0_g1_i1:1796-2503(+)